MINLFVNYSRGQIKIQQMAFVLVALMIFFAIVSLFYFSVRFNTLQDDVETLREAEGVETIRKMSSTPEFAWTGGGDCTACVDFDKVFVLKNRQSYEGFWRNIGLLQVTRVHPTFGGVECSAQNYPNGDTITLIDEETNIRGQRAFVALCRYDNAEQYTRCDLGKIVMAIETVQ